MCFEEIKELR